MTFEHLQQFCICTGFECENKFFSATNLLKFDDFVVFQQICITPPVYRQTEFSIFGENPTPPCPFPPFPFCNVFSWNLDCIRQEMEKGDWVSPHSYQVFLTIFLGYFVLFSGDTNNKNKLPFLICDNRCQWRGGVFMKIFLNGSKILLCTNITKYL